MSHDTAPAAPRRARSRDGVWPLVFLAPLMIGVAVFYFWPILATFLNSFSSFGPFGGRSFAGLDNYRALLTDSFIPRAVLNTAVYTAIVLLGIPIAVAVASLMNQKGLRFSRFYQVLFFLPAVSMPVAVALVWRMIFNKEFGIVNWALSLVGIDGPYWTTAPWWALLAVSIVGLWSSLPLAIIILSAGLQAIPAELYEAAQLDGAGTMRQFIAVTVPLLTPSIFFLTIITAINGFQLFDLLFAMMGDANPAMADTQSLVYLFYSEAFRQNDQGYASVIALLILLIIGVFTLLQFRMQKRWVHYE
ncbi:N-Acetyl-D-glucosamine ABC transport system, permease protein 1 [Brachybacterium faecium]|uniref:Permease component of ABC-type sugar transporter n=1 Tax=Brachybacterium faecium (strain ATCC 43885 / DSM 4810 / JCM 11609 / LMG 19847 / NBRC 14762 / NCIMB 9860 / 6-10) TaxID=446465 RepID=C7MI67_BRAFD|nr:sugar ABC transporter permease [Brachybacterium faecium]ACU84493.1 permease component of ABC-type sugar transporter [Brachybacterium faecium DSM 4810]SLM92254.1 N-Acetyl-D-glucosamine ABC transport system, permease protein 1 [Brachybacterium faecium]HJG51528.1 sugar ABC transporter permease [Brachybacterium faecium]